MLSAQDARRVSNTSLMKTNTKLRQELEEDKLLRRTKLCGCLDFEDFLFYSTFVVIFFDAFQSCVLLYTVVFFTLNTDESDFQPEFAEEYSRKEMGEVETDYALVMLPSAIMIFIKLYYGVQWVRQKYTFVTLKRYYTVSFSFYLSYLFQQLFVLIWTWNVFNNTFRGLVLTSLIVILPFWLILAIYVRYREVQNRQINQLRRQVQQERIKNHGTLESTRLLQIEARPSQQLLQPQRQAAKTVRFPGQRRNLIQLDGINQSMGQMRHSSNEDLSTPYSMRQSSTLKIANTAALNGGIQRNTTDLNSNQVVFASQQSCSIEQSSHVSSFENKINLTQSQPGAQIPALAQSAHSTQSVRQERLQNEVDAYKNMLRATGAFQEGTEDELDTDNSPNISGLGL